MRVRFLALMIVGLLLAPSLTTAQSATPAASPGADCTPQFFCSLSGFQQRVWRTFEHVGNTSFFPSVMQFGIVEFDTSESAAASMSPTVLECRKIFSGSNASDISGVTPVNVAPLGDETLALAGPVKGLQADGSGDYFAFCLAVRTGRYLRFAYSWEWSASPIDDTISMMTPSIKRDPTSSPIVKDAFGFSSGGLWDALPTLAEMMQGYRLANEST